jgi:hypothetical protein
VVAVGVIATRSGSDTLDAIVAALKLLDVIFVGENGEGPGVRLKKGGDAAK